MTNTLTVQAHGEREVVMGRVLDAPREMVFEAWTKPNLVKRWLFGPDDWPLTVCEIDLKVGGTLRWEWHHKNGKFMGMSGVYREVAPPGRLVFTEVWDDNWTGGEAVVTMEFVEKAGATNVTQTVLYSSRTARDNVLKTGMAQGVTQSYDRLEKLLQQGFKAETKIEGARGA